MNFVLRRCSDTLRNVAEERESGQLLNVTDFHILPLRTTFVIKQVSRTYCRDSLSSGEVYFHNTFEVLSRDRANGSRLILRRTIIASENRACNDI